MSQLRLAKSTDKQAFPGCASVIVDTPPATQCEETQINEIDGISTEGGYTLTEVGKFAGIDLAGKILSITTPPGNVGDYTIISNTDDTLTLATPTPEASVGNTYTVHDSGQTYLTRNESSFTRFAENLGNAHTVLNGQLYTDVATGPLAAACSVVYDPG